MGSACSSIFSCLNNEEKAIEKTKQTINVITEEKSNERTKEIINVRSKETTNEKSIEIASVRTKFVINSRCIRQDTPTKLSIRHVEDDKFVQLLVLSKPEVMFSAVLTNYVHCGVIMIGKFNLGNNLSFTHVIAHLKSNNGSTYIELEFFNSLEECHQILSFGDILPADRYIDSVRCKLMSNDISPFQSLLNSTSDKPFALNPLTFNYEHTRNCVKFIDEFAINCVVKQANNKSIPIDFRTSITEYILITILNMREEEVLLMDQDSLDERWRMIAMTEARPLSGLISDSNF